MLKFSFVILYHNRSDCILTIVRDIAALNGCDCEVIVVDNNSELNLCPRMEEICGPVQYVRLDSNLGAVARNRGIEISSGEYVVCLDDDVVGITRQDLATLEKVFRDPKVGAVCFKILDPEREISNWIHHYDKRLFSEQLLRTNEISEGAVCFRKAALEKVGLYYEKYFISHEGPDLACRLLDADYDILYCPDVVVMHYHSSIGRKSWRRYYYDTRNVMWLSLRNYPPLFALKKTFWGLVPMFIYALRDGFLRYWVKGVIDGLKGLPEVMGGRRAISPRTLEKIKEIESHRPNLLVLMKSRVFKKGVRI